MFLLTFGNHGTVVELATYSSHGECFAQAKHMIVLKDSIAKDIIHFLEHCESKE